MLSQGKKNVLGILVDAVDYEYAVDRIIHAARCQHALAVSALAVHGVMTGVLDAEHRYRLNSLDLVVPDGQPVRWALNLLHRCGLRDRVYGPNLTLRLCEQASEHHIPVFFYGSQQRVLDNLCQNLRSIFPGLIIVGVQPSLFRKTTDAEKQAVVKQIQESGAGIVFVGLGCPRQEVWAYEYRDHLNLPLIAVGAAFDFHAGLLSQAPAIMQRLGLEWLYRLLKEPRRLWKRYLYLNPLYLFCLLAQYLRIKKFDPGEATRPPKTLDFG